MDVAAVELRVRIDVGLGAVGLCPLADADPAVIDPCYVEAHVGNPNAKLTLVLGTEDEDAERLQQLATRRHQRPAEVVADLLRNA